MLRLTFSLLLLLSLTAVSNAQVADYDNAIAQSIQFHHLQVTMEFLPDEPTLRGVAAWQFSIPESGTPEVRLNSIRTEVFTVLINEKDADFFMSGDTLIVTPFQEIQTDTRHKLEVIYRSDLVFGLQRKDSGAFMSSMIPGAVANLLPVPLSPKVAVPIDIRMIMPSDWQGVANGIRTANILLPEGKRLFHWKTSEPAPVTQIGFFAGRLTSQITQIDGVSLNIYTQTDRTVDNLEEITETARKLVQAVHQVTDRKLPFGALNLVLVEDLVWDIAPFGHAYSYIDVSSDDVPAQLLRAVTHQYFGSALRSHSIDNADHILALKAILAHRVASMANITRVSLNQEHQKSWEYPVWLSLSALTWNTTLKMTDPRSRTLLEPDIREFLDEIEANFDSMKALDNGVYSWEELTSAVGFQNNRNVVQMIASNLPVVERYTAIYEFDEMTGRFTFELVPEQTYPQRYLSLTIRQFTDGTLNDLTVLASNMGDRLHLTSGGFVENMYIYNDDPLLEFTEIKPAAFWLYQLRRDGDADRRIESAEGFGRVQNDPDVQLILQDLIRNEPDPRVKARLVTSLSLIVGDAFGTNRRFMDLLSSESREVRFAALYALRNYASNEAVQQQVFRIISQSQDIEYVNLAIEVYKHIVNEREFYSVARSLLHEDTEDLYFTQTIIPLIVQTQQGVIFAPNLMDYLDDQYAFDLRRTAFDALYPLEIDSDYWAEILPELLVDSDPRMRYMALNLVATLPGTLRDEILQDRLYNEYDVRVLRRVSTLVP